MPGDLMTVVTYGLSVKGIKGDSDADVFILELINYYCAVRLAFAPLIRTYPLTEIIRAIADRHRGDCVEVVSLTS